MLETFPRACQFTTRAPLYNGLAVLPEKTADLKSCSTNGTSAAEAAVISKGYIVTEATIRKDSRTLKRAR